MFPLRVINQELPENIPAFEGRTVKAAFTVAEDQPYVGSTEMLEIPTILSGEKRRKLIGKSLEDGYKTAIPLANYMAFYRMKETAFLKWLRQHYVTGTPPDFICFGGRIADTLGTPIMFDKKHDKWEFFGTKFNNSVYLWTEPENWHNKRTLDCYRGLSFEALLTGKDPAKTPLNETKQSFVIQERDFGAHKLLLLIDVDGVDQEGNWVEIKAYKNCYLQDNTTNLKYFAYKFRNCWAQCVVAGQSKATFGGRDFHFLKQIVDMEIEEILAKAGITSKDVLQCCDFQNRLLYAIHSQFQDNEFAVKKFSWEALGQAEKESEVVTCTDVDEKTSWFAQQLRTSCK